MQSLEYPAVLVTLRSKRERREKAPSSLLSQPRQENLQPTNLWKVCKCIFFSSLSLSLIHTLSLSHTQTHTRTYTHLHALVCSVYFKRYSKLVRQNCSSQYSYCSSLNVTKFFFHFFSVGNDCHKHSSLGSLLSLSFLFAM